jgi:hypothetical protein
MSKLRADGRFGCAATRARTRSFLCALDANHAPERAVAAVCSVATMDLADLPGLFRISPIGTIENDHIRLQKGKIVSIESKKA